MSSKLYTTAGVLIFDSPLYIKAAITQWIQSFRKAGLPSANFSKLNLAGLNFSRSNFSGSVDFTAATFINVANVSFIINIDLTNCDFTNCDLTGCNFTSAQMSGCNFTGANLTGCNFSDADISNCTFINANLSGAIFNGNTNVNISAF